MTSSQRQASSEPPRPELQAIPEPKQDRTCLALLFALFLLTRAWLILSAPEELIISDALSTGLIYQSLVGPHLLPMELLSSPFMGGNLVYQVLALPFHALLGDRILAVFLLSLSVGAAGFWLLASLARRASGPSAALFAALLYTLLPPGWMGGALVGTGDHFLAGLLVLLSGALLAQWIEQAEGSARNLAWSAFFLGFSIYVDYIALLALPALLLTVLKFQPALHRRARPLLAACAGLLLGISPLVLRLAHRGWSEGTTLYGRRIGEHLLSAPLDALEKGWDLLGSVLVDSAWFPPFPLGDLGARIWWVALLAGLGLALWSERALLLRGRAAGTRPPSALALFLLLHLAFFGLGFSLLRFETEPDRLWGYRYLLAVQPSVCVLLALGLASCGPWRSRAVLTLWCVPNLLALGWPASLERPLRVLEFPGIAWNSVAARAITEWDDQASELIRERVPELPKQQGSAFLVDLGSQLLSTHKPSEVLAYVSRSQDPETWFHLSRGVLASIRGRSQPPLTGAGWFSLLDDGFTSRDGTRIQATLRGTVSLWRTSPERLRRELVAIPPDHWKAPLIAESLGANLFLRDDIPAVEAMGQTLEPTLLPALWFGAARQLALRSGGDLQRLHLDVERRPSQAPEQAWLSGLAFSWQEQKDVIQAPDEALRLVGQTMGGDSRATFSKAVGRAASTLAQRSTYRLARALALVALPEQISPLCEGIGEGMSVMAKTRADLLRWRIDWDRFLAPGCDQAFNRGLRESRARLLAGSPSSKDR